MHTPDSAWDKSSWVSLAEMADGFSEYRPEPTDRLAGSGLVLEREDGGEIVCTFTTASDALTSEGPATYEAFELAPDLLFLHLTWTPTAILTIAVDLRAGVFAGVLGSLSDDRTDTHVRQQHVRGRIGGASPDAALPEPSDELVGQRVRYRYSSEDVYDHVYLTAHLFTWLCVSGAEQGEADTDLARAVRMRDGVFMFSWSEKLLGVEGAVLIDLQAHRSVGIQYGRDQFSGDVVNITMGAYAQWLNAAPAVVPAPDAVPS